MALPIMHFKGLHFDFSKLSCISGCFILANSADPNEMQHNAAFHLGLHCLSTHPLRGFLSSIQMYKGLRVCTRINVTCIMSVFACIL